MYADEMNAAVTGAVKMAEALNLPQPPVFADPIEEQRHRKERLAAAFRLFSKFGFDDGVAGHITARDPVDPESFWVNPFGMHFGQIRVSDLVRVDEHGRVVEGRRGINPAAFAIHSRVHVARPDVVAAAHAHSVFGKTWSSLGRLLDPITQDACAFYEDHALFTEYRGVVLDNSEGDGIARALGKRKAVILQNHGLLTVGQSVDEAAWFFIMMERTCQCQLMAEAAGKPILIPGENARVALSQVGSHESGWFQFQPLWDRITREQPDLLD
jgi:ribulose-5-phosphate 4-epimerase/fuculose-1-phosphate aldolase